MAFNNGINLNGTGLVTADGDGTYSYSTVTDGGVLLGGANNTVSDTGVLAKGTLLVGNGSGAPTEEAVGTNDFAFTADSAQTSGTKWAAVGGGSGSGWVLLSTATASTSASLDFTSSIDSTYEIYAFVFDELRPTTDGAFLHSRISTDGGSTWESGSTTYGWAANREILGGPVAAGVNSDGELVLTSSIGNFTGERAGGLMFMYAPAATVYTRFTWHMVPCSQATAIYTEYGAGLRKSSTAVNAIQFFMSTSTIISGTIKMYGVCPVS